MKTIRQALIDDMHYPCPIGFIENRLIYRGLDGDESFSIEVAHSKGYKGALADCLYSLIEAPDYSEMNKSVALKNKDLILKKVNALYKSIGEDEVALTGEPMVYVGDIL